jgi:adenosylcobinamide-GDP ribazoletransferase
MSYRHGDIRRGGGRQSRVTSPLADLLTAFRLLTRLPFGRAAPVDLARGVWAFPIVGLTAGGLGALAYWLTWLLSMPPLVAASWSLAAMVTLTGALHEDGLADTVDGFGGGHSPERKLAIMRDSRIGGYGALALMMTVLVRVAAVAALNDPLHVMKAVCLAGLLGRGAIIVVMLVLRPARTDGLGAAFGNMDRRNATIGLSLTAFVCLLALPLRPASVAMLTALFASLGVAKLAHGQIGGYTGDVLGAAEVITECAVLSAAASAYGW